MTGFRPAPYSIAPDGMKPAPGRLMLRRYFCVALIEGDNYPAVHPLTRHFATHAAAESRLSGCLEEWPNAQVSSVLLWFDPEDSAQLEACRRFEDEALQERRELHQ